MMVDSIRATDTRSLSVCGAMFPMIEANHPIVGVGADIVHIPTFAQQLAEDGSHFRLVFTYRERRTCQRAADENASLAARWAGREAFVKAWSVALYGHLPALPDSVQLYQQIEIIHDRWHRPAFRFSGQVAQAFAHSFPDAHTFVSLSHDGDYAYAVAVIQSL